MSELPEIAALEFEISEAIDAYANREITRNVLDARLARLQPRTGKLRMPNQNYIGGFITGYLRAKKVAE